MGFAAVQILTGITKLSELAIDVNKDWLTKLIKGLGNPVAAQDAATKAYVDIVDARLDDVSVAEPSRAINTTYQNGAKLRLVSVRLSNTTTDTDTFWVSARIGPSDSIELYVASWGWYGNPLYVGDRAIPLVFLVPSSWYYGIEQSIDHGLMEILGWTEWDLF
jgi:hypothetical protein